MEVLCRGFVSGRKCEWQTLYWGCWCLGKGLVLGRWTWVKAFGWRIGFREKGMELRLVSRPLFQVESKRYRALSIYLVWELCVEVSFHVERCWGKILP